MEDNAPTPEEQYVPTPTSETEYAIEGIRLLSGKNALRRKQDQNEAPGILSGPDNAAALGYLKNLEATKQLDKPITRPERITSRQTTSDLALRGLQALKQPKERADGQEPEDAEGHTLPTSLQHASGPESYFTGLADAFDGRDNQAITNELNQIADRWNKRHPEAALPVLRGLVPRVFGNVCHGPDCNVKVKDDRWLCKKHELPQCTRCGQPTESRSRLCNSCTTRMKYPERWCTDCGRKHQKPGAIRRCNDCTRMVVYDWRVQCARCHQKFTGRKITRTRPGLCGPCQRQAFKLGVLFDGTLPEAKQAARDRRKEFPGVAFAVDFNRVTGLYEVRAQIERVQS